MSKAILSAALLAMVLSFSTAVVAQKRAVSGIKQRIPWTTSKIVGTPDPPHPYTTKRAFPGLKFYEPLAVGRVPGTNRFVVAERPGKIFTFADKDDVTSKKLLLDVRKTLYGVAMHPDFQKNGLFFVTQVEPGAGKDPGNIEVYRYRVTDPKTLKAARRSGKRLISWKAGGHSGGCLRFGADGFLYISVGDGSGIADGLKTGQDLKDLHGSILRIDVDRPGDGRPYGIPRDNPFVRRPSARPEVYSYGHRQIWKFSFDRQTSRMWAGEVGQDLWEMVYLIRKGGNYGWSVREGNHPFRPRRPHGPTPFVAPIVEHSHNDFRSITGGYVFRMNDKHPLNERYIYGDYDTGKLWSLWYDGREVKEHRELADTQLRTVAFAKRGNGEVLVVDFAGGGFHRLVKAPPRPKNQPDFPRKLSETGLFASTKDHKPAAGLISYSVNSPLWSDNAGKLRFIGLPGRSRIEFEAVTYPQPAPGSEPGWRFPDGTVLVKTFSLEMETGNPKSRRRLETRILHHERMPGNDDEYGAQVWRGYTYVWNDEQTDAILLDAKGLDRDYTIKDKSAPGGTRKQKWHFPSRAECTLCHTMASKYVLGVNTLQMNKDHDYGGVTANQLSTLSHIGAFTRQLTKKPKQYKKIVDYRDKSAKTALRARAYLHANCSHCHRKWGGGNAEFQLLASLAVDKTGTLGVPPGQGKFNVRNGAILVAGKPEQSLLLHRMKLTGLGRMPHVASNMIHKEALGLIENWIREMDAKGIKKTGILPK